MKRIISALLTVAMLVTLITVPMMVTADAWSKPAAITNSADLFNTNDYAKLYAVNGTPTVDGTIDAEWADAYTLRIDYSHMAAYGASKMKMNTYIDIYMMWDADNLYILETREYDKVAYKGVGQVNFWDSGYDNGNCYILSLPTPFTDDEVTNDGAANMVFVHVGNATTDTPVAAGSVTKQTKYYKDNTGAINPINYAADTTVTTYTALTETGFLMETAIPWDTLDNYTPGFEATADMILGLAMYYIPGWQGNGNYAHYGDEYGFQQVQLLGEGVDNPTADPIKPDFSWYDSTATTYEIWDASDLLGLLELSHLHGSSPLKAALGTVDSTFNGKTIEIMADIDLNPGTTFNADGTWTGATPVVGWTCLQDFKGTIDGNGHTISGLYCYNGMTAGTGSELRYIGLVGRGGAGLTIKDLSLTNGYMSVTKGTTNQSAASFLAVAHHYNGAGTITLENLYSDLHIVGSEFGGGIVGSTWYDNTLVWDVENCVFAGTANATKTAGTLMGRDSHHTTKNSGSIKNCYVPVDTKAIGSNAATVVETGDAAYVQSTDVADGKINVRLLGLIDEAELDLDSVGMKVTVKYGEDTYTKELDGKTNVFATVNAAGTEIAVESLAGDYDYAYGVVLKGVPAGADDKVIIDVVLTRVINGVEVQSVCTYSATYVAGVLQ